MTHSASTAQTLDEGARDFYLRTLHVLAESGVPFLIGGAYAFAHHTGIERHTKDLDVFTRPVDAPRLLAALEAAGYRTECAFPHWLSKARGEEHFVDVIHSSGNGVGVVDDGWFEHAVDARLLGVPVRLAPVEEMIWHKAYVCERERFDGADVLHLLRAHAEDLAWGRLLQRFGAHWQLLLAHVMMFGFVYPTERARLPAALTRSLLDLLAAQDDTNEAPERVCRGPLLSREQYLPDLERWGYADARVTEGHLTPEDVALWTDAIG